MTRYVGLLRGVNVGGVTVRMADLAELVTGLGWGGVRTVVASGNVLFDADEPADAAKARLEAALRERFGYDAWVHVLPLDAVRAIRDAYPFERGRDGWHDYVVVVVDEATRAELLAVAGGLGDDPGGERAAAGDGVVYWTVERGSTLRSPFGAAQSKGKHKRWLTTRNLNTIDRILS
jgi:uncharacterized protein (DUF1697 family)